MKKTNPPAEPPKNAMEYYNQLNIGSRTWQQLDRKTRRRWKRSFKEAYPQPRRPLIRNFRQLLSDISAAIETFRRLFPGK